MFSRCASLVEDVRFSRFSRLLVGWVFLLSGSLS